MDCLQIQIFGDGELEPNRDAAHMVAIECCKMDFPLLVCQKLAYLDFESRKDAAQVKTLSSLTSLELFGKVYCILPQVTLSVDVA